LAYSMVDLALYSFASSNLLAQFARLQYSSYDQES